LEGVETPLPITGDKMDTKQWFKNQLKMIEIEVFSYCDRKCWFCPNSFIDRQSTNILLDTDQYLNILEQLKEIDYDQEITYSRYNEPLSHKAIILERISQARQYLPKAKLRTNTNGNFLTTEYIYELRDAGLNELFIQQYLANDEEYDHFRVKSRMLKKISRLDLDAKLITDIPGQRIEYDLSIPGMTIHIRARNFAIEGTSRTDEVAEYNKDYVRTAPCMQPFNNMYIDYNGYVMVCCNTRSDIPEHANGVMAHVSEDKLWNIYMKEKYNSWREHLKDESPKSGICSGCKNDIIFT